MCFFIVFSLFPQQACVVWEPESLPTPNLYSSSLPIIQQNLGGFSQATGASASLTKAKIREATKKRKLAIPGDSK